MLNAGIMSVGHSISLPPVFDGSNYAYWKERMRVFIRANNFRLWQIIKYGEQMTEQVGQAMVSEHNTKAINMLYRSLNQEICRKISHCKSAKEVWDKLEDFYENTPQEADSSCDEPNVRCYMADGEEEVSTYDSYSFEELQEAFNDLFYELKKVSKIAKEATAKSKAFEDENLFLKNDNDDLREKIKAMNEASSIDKCLTCLSCESLQLENAELRSTLETRSVDVPKVVKEIKKELPKKNKRRSKNKNGVRNFTAPPRNNSRALNESRTNNFRPPRHYSRMYANKSRTNALRPPRHESRIFANKPRNSNFRQPRNNSRNETRQPRNDTRFFNKSRINNFRPPRYNSRNWNNESRVNRFNSPRNNTRTFVDKSRMNHARPPRNDSRIFNTSRNDFRSPRMYLAQPRHRHNPNVVCHYCNRVGHIAPVYFSKHRDLSFGYNHYLPNLKGPKMVWVPKTSS
uniref:Putative gag protein n=1 Tax=Nicotiana tabacum TaxID=4097 RepID=Q9ZTG6_TOBAC|nr:putative gag protein [Nicotiana tabacum]